VTPGLVVVRVDGPLFYANSASVKDHLLALVRSAGDRPAAVVLELDQTDIDVETLDMLSELAGALAAKSVELRLASVRRPVRSSSGGAGSRSAWRSSRRWMRRPGGGPDDPEPGRFTRCE
jgi:MFS superfamily sulfate permease-like transporter